MTLFINSSFIGNPYLGCLRMALSSAQFWFALILTLGILLIPVIAIRFYTFNLYPTLSDKVRLKQRLTRFKSAVKSQLPPTFYASRRKSSVRRSRRSVRSGYAFAHQEGFGGLIMSGKLAQKPSSTRYSGFNPINESLSNSLCSNVAGVTFSNNSLHLPKAGIVPITGIAAMGNLAIASAGGLPTVDRDSLLMEQPIKTATTTNKPKLTVANSMDNETIISLDSKSSSRQSKKAKLKNTQQQSSLSNQSVHSIQSMHSSNSNGSATTKQAKKLDSKQSTIDQNRSHHSNELRNQASSEEANRSISSNQSNHREEINKVNSNESINQESLNKVLISKQANKKSSSRNTLSRQATNQSDHSDSIHSDSSLPAIKSTKNLKSLDNLKSNLSNEQINRNESKLPSLTTSSFNKPVSKSIENLLSTKSKALTAEERRNRLQAQLSQPSSSASKLNKRSQKDKVVSSIEI